VATYRHHLLLARLRVVFCHQCYTLFLHMIVYRVMKVPLYMLMILQC